MSSRVISSRGHFSLPDPDVLALPAASVSPAPLCPPRPVCSTAAPQCCRVSAAPRVRSLVWSELVPDWLNTGKLSEALDN